MVQVIVKGNNVERAIRQLKKKLMKEGILREIRLREAYEKPTLKRQRKHKESLRRVAKDKRMKRLRDRRS
ncbi:MAG: 30S ribosomal protein S21 [Rickettsiales bacterium]|jgi:small subunit ribosomal protein S21|nr:30S ribosomal protein S21 [Rickettsiales bacterium]|tara:strand:- start:344 stop:553 length:210 start_codon:yes stop_codon:yes gene_type:complete